MGTCIHRWIARNSAGVRDCISASSNIAMQTMEAASTENARLARRAGWLTHVPKWMIPTARHPPASMDHTTGTRIGVTMKALCLHDGAKLDRAHAIRCLGPA